MGRTFRISIFYHKPDKCNWDNVGWNNELADKAARETAELAQKYPASDVPQDIEGFLLILLVDSEKVQCALDSHCYIGEYLPTILRPGFVMDEHAENIGDEFFHL